MILAVIADPILPYLLKLMKLIIENHPLILINDEEGNKRYSMMRIHYP